MPCQFTGTAIETSDEMKKPCEGDSPWVQNMEFVKAAFRYQKEALELRCMQDIRKLPLGNKARRVEETRAKQMQTVLDANQKLKHMAIEISEHYAAMEMELENTHTQLEDNEIEIKRLTGLSIILAYCGIRNQPIPPDVMLQCKEQMTSDQTV
jgi:hypothetical protein